MSYRIKCLYVNKTNSRYKEHTEIVGSLILWYRNDYGRKSEKGLSFHFVNLDLAISDVCSNAIFSYGNILNLINTNLFFGIKIKIARLQKKP